MLAWVVDLKASCYFLGYKTDFLYLKQWSTYNIVNIANKNLV